MNVVGRDLARYAWQPESIPTATVEMNIIVEAIYNLVKTQEDLVFGSQTLVRDDSRS